MTAPFTVSGQPRIGQPLEVVPGTFEPSDAQVTYTWLRDGVEIPGATGPAYVPGEGDVGAHISVLANLTRQGYKPASQTTDPTTPVHTVPELQVSAVGKPERARVTLTITAPGVAAVKGPITVRVGSQTVSVRVRDGVRSVTVRGLHRARSPSWCASWAGAWWTRGPSAARSRSPRRHARGVSCRSRRRSSPLPP